ncbi:MAG: molecular chaperone DjiA [Paracoccaceae bacterium]
MSLWSRISEALQALSSGEGLAAVFDRLRTPPERSVAFAIAVIALGAKMAKADGHVTRDEVTAFREIFHIAVQDEAGAARVFNLARQDVAGFEEYAARIRNMFEGHPQTLSDLVEGLFYIAMADGIFHPNENAFLERVCEIFELEDREYRAIRARFVPGEERDPHDVLGVDPSMPLEDMRKIWRKMVRENHPDAMLSRGVPEEAIRLAEKRMIDINRAWEEITSLRTL